MEWGYLVLWSLGFTFLTIRLHPRARFGDLHESDDPLVSIIIPARNESHNVDRILSSLENLNYPRYEVLLVDDGSTDETYNQALKYQQVQVLRSSKRPPGWLGKSWACHQGALKAQGEYLLFTDADTYHFPDSLKRALDFMRIRQCAMISAIPYHSNPSWWETGLGPFQLLVFLASGAFSRPRPGRLYAIGQYLLFERGAYQAIGGHEAICQEAAEDLALAERLVRSDHKFEVYQSSDLYQVRMYSSFSEFWAGWRRIFWAGFYKSSVESLAVMVLVINCVLFGGLWGYEALVSGLYIILVLYFLSRQSKIGRFHVLGAAFFPVSVLIFCLVSFQAAMDHVLKRPVLWKGREIQARVKS